jgi:hypothetical protein
MVEGVFGDEQVGRRPIVRVAEKSSASELDIAEVPVRCPPARERQHLCGDVDRVDGLAAGCRRRGESAGPTADVDDDVLCLDVQLIEKGEFGLIARTLIAIVGLDRGTVFEIQSDLPQVVIVPVRHGAPRLLSDRPQLR